MIIFSKRLKDLLYHKKISIKNFAKSIGMSEIGLHNAIKNNSTKIETIYKIAEELNVAPSYFFKTDAELDEDAYHGYAEMFNAELNYLSKRARFYEYLLLNSLSNKVDPEKLTFSNKGNFYEENYSDTVIKKYSDIVELFIKNCFEQERKKAMETGLLATFMSNYAEYRKFEQDSKFDPMLFMPKKRKQRGR